MTNKILKTSLASALFTATLILSPSAVLAETNSKNVEQTKSIKSIDLKKAQELYKENKSLFIDARPMKLYSKGTIMGALQMTTKDFKAGLLPRNKNASIVTFCNGASCEKSLELAKKIQKEGYTNVMVYTNGYPEWEEMKQVSMALKKDAKEEVLASNTFKPSLDKVSINGVEVYLLPEDGEANEDGLIDQFWFEEQLRNNTVPKGITLVDVRKAEKYEASHIQGSISVPYDSESETLDISKLPKDGVVVFYCNSGLKSTDARGSLEDELAERVLIFDATYKCDKSFKNCKLTPNEAI